MPECANCRAVALWKSGGEYLCRDCLVALLDAEPPPEDIFAERLSFDRETLPAPPPASTWPPPGFPADHVPGFCLCDHCVPSDIAKPIER